MNVVVTGGGTIAPIDDVRHIANASTGRLAAEIAEACLARDGRVWHLMTPAAQAPFFRLARFDLDAPDPLAEHARLDAIRRRWLASRDRFHPVPIVSGTVGEYAAKLELVLREKSIDVAFLAMAASDYEPMPRAGKIESSRDSLTIDCRPTPKVIRHVRDWSPGVYLVGFKLLSGATEDQLVRAALDACRVNRADLTVANDMSTVRGGRHTIHLVRPGRDVETLGPPASIAEGLVERVFRWAGERGAGPARVTPPTT